MFIRTYYLFREPGEPDFSDDPVLYKLAQKESWRRITMEMHDIASIRELEREDRTLVTLYNGDSYVVRMKFEELDRILDYHYDAPECCER